MNIENYPSSSSERKSDITNRSATLSSSNLPDEDDILNAPDDIHEWNNDLDEQIIDEDGILGDNAGASTSFASEQSSTIKSTDASIDSLLMDKTIEELDYEERIATPMTTSVVDKRANTPTEDDDDDDDNNDTGATRDKFQSERRLLSTVGGTTRSYHEIPDSLDNVRIQNAADIGGGYRYAQKKVLINPRYRGTIEQQPNIRLRWDASRTPIIQLGAIKIVPPRPIIPTLSNIGMVNRFHPMPNTNNYRIVPPTNLCMMRPLPPPAQLASFRPMTRPLLGPPPPTHLFAVRPNVISQTPQNWNQLVEDFVQRTSHRRTTSRRPRSSTSRSRSPRRRSASKSPSPISRRSSSIDRPRRKRTNAAEQDQPKPANPAMRTESDLTQQTEINKVAGVDNEYMRKLEEQKRLREEIVRKKEQRRLIEMAKKRNDSTVDKVKSTVTVKQAEPLVADRNQSKPKSAVSSRLEPKPQSTAVSRREQKAPSIRSKNDTKQPSNANTRNVENPKSTSSSRQSAPSQKRTDIDVGKLDKTTTDTVAVLPKRTINERFSDVKNEKKPKPMPLTHAVVVRDISKWDAAFGRLTIVAGTVGRVKKCWQPTRDAVAIVFEEDDKAVRFMQQYNGQIMGGIKLNIKLEPVSETVR